MVSEVFHGGGGGASQKTSANFDMNLRVRHHSGYLDFQDGKDEEGSLIIHVCSCETPFFLL